MIKISGGGLNYEQKNVVKSENHDLFLLYASFIIYNNWSFQLFVSK